MRIAVDLDGVCYHWERTARYMLRRWYADRGELHPAMLDRASRHWDDIQQNVSPEAWDWLWSEGVDRGLFRHGHIVSGTIEALTALTGDGHEVFVATARPKRAIGDTLAWIALQLHRVPLSDVRIHVNKLATDADLYVDDGIHNILAVTAAGKRAILFNQPWNCESPTPLDWSLTERAFGWGHAVELIRTCP